MHTIGRAVELYAEKSSYPIKQNDQTGRYEQLPEHERICPLCRYGIEKEYGVFSFFII